MIHTPATIQVALTDLALSLAGPRATSAITAAIADRARQAALAKGGRSFWRSLADSISSTPSGVTASHPAAGHKQTGGTITARKAGFLAIPVGQARDLSLTPATARQSFRLFRVTSRRGSLLLFGSPSPSAQPQPLFVLKRSVTQAADPWFPEGQELTSAITAGIKAYQDTI